MPKGPGWLAWAELGAQRNRQRYAYRATIAGLLQREGWELQAPGPEPCPAAGAVAAADLKAMPPAAYRDAADQALIGARPLTTAEAAELAERRRLEPLDQAALDRHRLAERWGLEGCPPTLELLEADRDGLRDRLRLGWLLDHPRSPRPDPCPRSGRDRCPRSHRPALRPRSPAGGLAPRISALQALGLPQLLERFAAMGMTIAATDALCWPSTPPPPPTAASWPRPRG
jgi:hypothetical protein